MLLVNQDKGLDVSVQDDMLVISIGVTTLAAATTSAGGMPEWRVTKPKRFARDIAAALCDEDEAGETMVTRALSAAAVDAIENASDNVERDPDFTEDGDERR